MLTTNELFNDDDLIDYTHNQPGGAFDGRDENGSGGTTGSVGRSFDQRIDGLLSGIKWAGTSISYSDPDSRSDYQAGHPEPLTNFQQI
jgi:hypothetical protein